MLREEKKGEGVVYVGRVFVSGEEVVESDCSERVNVISEWSKREVFVVESNEFQSCREVSRV